jgi:hypothetical protein
MKRLLTESAVVIAAYMLAVAALLWTLIPRLDTHILSYDIYPIPDASDAFDWVWRYAWFLDHWYRPWTFFNGDTIFPPTGESLLFHSHPIVSEALTLPVGLLAGPVVATNIMILALLVGAACACYGMIRRAFRFQPVPAFIGGFWFGCCPYFLFRAHKHVNLIGGAFWGGALAIVLYAYLRKRFTPAGSAGFALLFWATFWNSFVEVFMLALVVGLTIACFELPRLHKDYRTLPKRVVFFLPTLLGVVSLLALRGGPDLAVVSNPLVDTGGLLDLFRFPKLGPLAHLGTPSTPSGWGATFSYSALALACIGAPALRKRLGATFIPLCALLGLLLVLTINPFNLSSALVRALPLGDGFRVFNRFFPFVVLLLTPFVASGVATLLNAPRPILARTTLAALVALLVFECYPLQQRTRPVRDLHVPPHVRATLDTDRFCLIVPEGDHHYQVHNTYYATLGLPAVNLSYWDKMSAKNKAHRTEEFPHVYPAGGDYPAAPDVNDPAILQELAQLNVGYVLFADKADLPESVIRGEVVWETGREILIALPQAAQ